MSTPAERLRDHAYREAVLKRQLNELIVEYRHTFPKDFDAAQINDFRRFMASQDRTDEAVELFANALRTNKPLAMDLWDSLD